MYLRFYVLEALDYVLEGGTEMEDDILGTDMNILVMDMRISCRLRRIGYAAQGCRAAEAVASCGGGLRPSGVPDGFDYDYALKSMKNT